MRSTQPATPSNASQNRLSFTSATKEETVIETDAVSEGLGECTSISSSFKLPKTLLSSNKDQVILYTYTHAHMHREREHTQTHACTHAHTHPCIERTHTDTHMCTHTDAHILSFIWNSFCQNTLGQPYRDKLVKRMRGRKERRDVYSGIDLKSTQRFGILCSPFQALVLTVSVVIVIAPIVVNYVAISSVHCYSQ